MKADERELLMRRLGVVATVTVVSRLLWLVADRVGVNLVDL